MLGNGKSLPISHMGHTSLSTPSRSLQLHNFLVVPQLRNNDINISKVSKSNNVSFEFFPYNFWVKDFPTIDLLSYRS